MLDAVLQLARERGLLAQSSALVAVDSTGLEARHISHYYGKRCGRRMTYYAKLSAVCDTLTHLILWAIAERGPNCDHMQFRPAVLAAYQLQPFEHLVADAGYDAEHHHALVTIPARAGRPSQRAPTGQFRQQMRCELDKSVYGQRWQIESTFSQWKRRLGSALRARAAQAQNREVHMRVLTLNLMLTYPFRLLFSTEQVRPLLPEPAHCRRPLTARAA